MSYRVKRIGRLDYSVRWRGQWWYVSVDEFWRLRGWHWWPDWHWYGPVCIDGPSQYAGKR